MAARDLVAMIVVGVGIVAAAAVALRGGGSAKPVQPVVVASQQQQQLGVRGEPIDTARRDGAEAEAPPEFVLPAVRPGPVAAQQPGRGEPSGPPAAAVPPSAAAVAEDAAIEAALPKARAAVDAALADRRTDLRRSCWKGAVPATASFPVEVSYGADGSMLALSVGDSAGRDAHDVGSCLRGQGGLVPPTIEAPGVGVTVHAALTLP